MTLLLLQTGSGAGNGSKLFIGFLLVFVGVQTFLGIYSLVDFVVLLCDFLELVFADFEFGIEDILPSLADEFAVECLIL